MNTWRMWAVLTALSGGLMVILAQGDEAVPEDAAKKNGPAQVTASREVVLVIHGGAGVIPRAEMTKKMEAAHRADLEAALAAGQAALARKGASSLDAVEAAIRVLEDSPLFNAGKGAAFNHDGMNRLDASIMDGTDKRAGAVAGVTIIKNPISAARAVMEKSEHVLLTGRGAEMFAAAQGLEIVDPSYFWTAPRWQRLQDVLKQENKSAALREAANRFGTVGAVAVDAAGRIAAGTSTGGLTNVKHGRVGDSPIIGAGTCADNHACGVSGTGHGEIFIRYSVAHEIVALVKHRNQPVHEAARTVIDSLPYEDGGVGGVIVLDKHGNCGLAFNTDGMYRGYLTRDGKKHVAIW